MKKRVAAFLSAVVVLSLALNAGRLLLFFRLGMSVRTYSEWVVGFRVPVSIHVVNALTGGGRSASARLLLIGENSTLELCKLEVDGSKSVGVRVPDVESGRYRLRVEARSLLAWDAVEVPVKVRRSYRVLITVDKPWYKPGQTIMFRALVWRASEGGYKPACNASVRVSLVGPKGTKLFGKALVADEFGVVSCEIPTSPEITEGRYRVVAEVDGCKQEVTVNVRRYVLPKFKVDVSLDRSWYLLGDSIRGVVNASYFFGKPVSNASVYLRASAYLGEWRCFWQYSGRTDERGLMEFELDAPKYLVGLEPYLKKAPLQLNVTVVDQAGHSEEASLPVLVSDTPFIVGVVALKDRFLPGEPYKLYITVRHPDGSPASGAKILAALAAGEEVVHRVELEASEAGVAELTFTPPDVKEAKLQLTVSSGGYASSCTFKLFSQKPERGVLIRVYSDKPRYKVGEEIKVRVLVKRSGNVSVRTIYLDVVSPLDKSTLYTGAAEAEGEIAEFKITARETFAPFVVVRAYAISPDFGFYSDWVKVDVEPPRRLRVEVKADKESYLPGEEAKLRVRVTEPGGEAKDTVVCLCIVDSSVLALEEKAPGFEEVFYMLGEEYQEIQWEIHELEEARIESRSRHAEIAEKLQSQVNYMLILGGYFMLISIPPAMLAIGAYLWARGRRAGKKLVAIGAMATLYLAYFAYIPLFHMLISPTSTKRWARENLAPPRRYVVAPPPAPEEAPLPPAALTGAEMAKEAESRGEAGGEKPMAVALRWFFPETLYWCPELPVSAHAEVNLKLAHSITTWSVKAIASTREGEIGVGYGSIRVFKEFFVEPDIPIEVTQDDELDLPVAVYNYVGRPLRVKLKLEAGGWAEILDGESRVLDVAGNSVSAAHWRIRARKAGVHFITVYAEAEGHVDAVRRAIEVEPNGVLVEVNRNGELKGTVVEEFTLPAIGETSIVKAYLRISPGYESMLVSGLEALTGFPGGCNEQVSSKLIPDILVLRYLTREGEITPELRAKLESYAQTGLQTLLSRQHPSGAMGWYATDEDNLGMSAWILNTFAEARKAGFILDENAVERLRSWILRQQRGDGSFDPVGFYGHGAYQPDRFVMTAYVLRSLLNSGLDPSSKEAEAALSYLEAEVGRSRDSYGLALAVLCFRMAGVEKGSSSLELAVSRLVDMAVEREDGVYWPNGSSFAGPTENTAYAAMALLEAGEAPELVKKAVSWLLGRRSSHGWLRTTSDTCAFLELLVRISEKGLTRPADIDLTVSLNGVEVYREHISPETSDVERIVSLDRHVRLGLNRLEIAAVGKGSLTYQLVARQWLREELRCRVEAAGEHCLGEIAPIRVIFEPPASELKPVMVKVRAEAPSGVEVIGGGVGYVNVVENGSEAVLYCRAREPGEYEIKMIAEYSLMYGRRVGGSLAADLGSIKLKFTDRRAKQPKVSLRKHIETLCGLPLTMVGVPVKVVVEVKAEEDFNGVLEDYLPAGFIASAIPPEAQADQGKVRVKLSLRGGDVYRLEYMAEPLARGDYLAPGAALLAEGKPIAVSEGYGVSVSDTPIVIRRELESTRIAESDELEIKVMVAYLGLGANSPVINMLFITVGLPPGFEADVESLRQAVEETPQLERFELHSPTRIDFLTGRVEPGTVFEFTFKARAKYPLKATVPPAEAQDYYNPDLSHITAPAIVEVSG